MTATGGFAIFYCRYDDLVSVTYLADASATIVEYYEYDAYGKYDNT